MSPLKSALSVRGLADLGRRRISMKMAMIPAAVLGVAGIGAEVLSQGYDLSIFMSEKDHEAPIDRGYGPGVSAPSARSKLTATSRLAASAEAPLLFGGLGQTPPGGTVQGLFGPEIPWPIIPIHVSLLPDGRVLTYGTDEKGAQGSALVYDIWDPKLGVGPESHQTLPNATKTDIFCGTGAWIGEGLNGATTSLTGKFLSLGGDLTVNGVRNYGNNEVVIIDPTDGSATSLGKMQFQRWYATTLTLTNGDKLLLGGLRYPGGTGVTTPEIFSPTTGWRTLSGISITDAEKTVEWYYPRASVGVDGKVYLVQHNGKILKLDTNTTASLTDTGVRLAWGGVQYPAVTLPVKPNYPAFKLLTVRFNKTAQVVDLGKTPPTVTTVGSLRYDRQWGTLTTLADGLVLANGGSGVPNELTDVAYETELFHPAGAYWSKGAKAKVPRLYHSTSLLLPDGSVLTAGGGAPGPIKNLNAEIYYPYYLYNYSTDGSPAKRPTIVSAPSSIKPSQTFNVTVGTDDKVGFVTLARAGYQTHTFDPEARLIYVDFSQNGPTVTLFMKPDPKVYPPGYYMLFVFDTDGHPSIAKMVSIPQVVP